MTPYWMHMDPEVFPDPHAFYPARWICDPAKLRVMYRYFVPFSKGSRTCIGREYVFTQYFCSQIRSSFSIRLTTQIVLHIWSRTWLWRICSDPGLRGCRSTKLIRAMFWLAVVSCSLCQNVARAEWGFTSRITAIHLGKWGRGLRPTPQTRELFAHLVFSILDKETYWIIYSTFSQPIAFSWLDL